MWEQQLKGDKDENWYKKSVVYWDEQPATADGVLGGYEEVHGPDSKTSLEMLQESKKWISGWKDALDCGAGIGRITKYTLLPKFQNVDLIEPSSNQLNEAKRSLRKARNFYCHGM